MLTIVLIRTGATEYRAQGRVQGTLDVPLSEDGRQEIERVAADLRDRPLDAIYAGPGQATIQTAEIVAEQADLKVKTVDQLGNLDHGLWQGMLIDEVKAKQPKVYRQWQEHPETVCPPDGETLQSASERLEQAIGKIIKKHKKGVIAVVVAEPSTSILRNLLADEAIGDLWQLPDNSRSSWDWIQLSTKVTAS